ncbi:E3 ubiquitin protein ligase RIE1-like isoform X2 [Nicotiana tabacum]|uniref:E3 ubiquitin protein ligase RIE1-like isoform X2 n=1 Tax=Nicotiana tabacum TaxID=4097 RepID=A0AC58S158_TOBAC
MESYGTNGDSNLTFNGTLNAATNSTGAYRVRVENTLERMVESIVSVIRGLQETTAALTFLIRNNLALMIPESDDGLEDEEDEDDEQGILPSEELFKLHRYLKNVNAGWRARAFDLSIKLHKYESSTSLESNENCCICLDDYCDGEELAKTDCGHLYHVDCIKKWIERNKSCPICKRDALAILQV